MKIGDIGKLDYGKNNINNKEIHIRGIIDSDQVVFRYHRNGQWLYDLQTLDHLAFLEVKGDLVWLVR